MVTALAAFSTSADGAARTGVAFAPCGASVRNTSPGMTTTATPPRASAVRIAISRIRGSWLGMLTSSQ